jgi:RNA polymerase sigma-70 factor (ECF subfamily)
MADDVFATTHWSVVLGIGDARDAAAGEALTRLCQTYWPPLFAFLRRQGYAPHDAEDLVQGFFERFMAEEFWRDVHREKGRFRSFLLGALRHHVANVHRHDRAQRRGGSRVHVTLDEAGVSERCEAALATHAVAEQVFDRVWAETVLAQAGTALRREYEQGGKGVLYAGIRRWLASEARPGEYAGAAPALGISEGALAVAVHRMRQRFQQLVRAQVAHTVAAPGEVEEELRHLLAVLTGR